MSAALIEDAETHAASDVRDFEIRLDFSEGEIFKMIQIIDPETSAKDVIAAIRRGDDNEGFSERDKSYADILCADVPRGKIRVCRNGKPVTILEWWQTDGYVKSNEVTFLDPDATSRLKIDAPTHSPPAETSAGCFNSWRDQR